MKNNTKIRLHLSKALFESLTKQVLAEAKKGNMSGGAYTEAVKAPKTHKEKSPEVKKTDKMKTMGEMETRVAEENPVNENSLQDFMQIVQDNADFFGTTAGIVAAAKWIASKIEKNPDARKALDKATGGGSAELGPLGGKSFDFDKKKD